VQFPVEGLWGGFFPFAAEGYFISIFPIAVLTGGRKFHILLVSFFGFLE